MAALLGTLEFQESAKGHFALYNCLVLGHTKYNGIQRVYCNPFLAKPLHGSHRLDIVMIRPPGIDNGAFVVSPDTVWYARVLLLFSASHLLWLTLDPSPSNAHLYRRWKNSTILRMVIISIISLISIMSIMLIIAIKTFQHGWNLLVPGSYTSLTTRIWFSTSSPLKVSFENCRRFLSVTPEPNAPGDRRAGSGDGCRMWFVNSWALGWSRDM